MIAVIDRKRCRTCSSGWRAVRSSIACINTADLSQQRRLSIIWSARRMRQWYILRSAWVLSAAATCTVSRHYTPQWLRDKNRSINSPVQRRGLYTGYVTYLIFDFRYRLVRWIIGHLLQWWAEPNTPYNELLQCYWTMTSTVISIQHNLQSTLHYMHYLSAPCTQP